MYNKIIEESLDICSLAVFDYNQYMKVDDEGLIKTIIQQIDNMNFTRESSKYFFDLHNKRYVETDELRIIDDKPRTELMGLFFDEYDEAYSNIRNREIIFQPGPRPDGKEICAKLREMRIQFAKANGLRISDRECNYAGPCAGTCRICEEEMKQLRQQIENKADIRYPYSAI